jgi:acetyl esterase
MSATKTTVVVEPAAQALVEATSHHPFLFELPPEEGRRTLAAPTTTCAAR